MQLSNDRYIEQGRRDALNEGLGILDDYADGRIQVPNPAVIFDVDDTLIDSQTERCIYPMLLLYRRVRELGIPIFIVTARPKDTANITRNQLRSLGFTGYIELFMVGYHDKITPQGVQGKGARKAHVRQVLTKHGYNILLNVGDDISDFEKGYFMYGIKLP